MFAPCLIGDGKQGKGDVSSSSRGPCVTEPVDSKVSEGRAERGTEECARSLA